jgi:hypothetical protein
MNFTIKRSKWLRGQSETWSALLRIDGMQCCVGQMCSQLGISDDELLGESIIESLVESPDDIEREEKRLNPLVRIRDDDDGPRVVEQDWINECYSINDMLSISDAEREQLLIAQAASDGHTLTFVD